MAGSVTFTNRAERKKDGLKCLEMAWTATSGGAVSGNASEAIRGEIVKIVTDPGTPAPTDNYDIVINDEHGLDVAEGQLANRHTTTTQVVYPGVNLTDGSNTAVHRTGVCGTLTPVISTAGNLAQGTIYLYYKE